MPGRSVRKRWNLICLSCVLVAVAVGLSLFARPVHKAGSPARQTVAESDVHVNDDVDRVAESPSPDPALLSGFEESGVQRPAGGTGSAGWVTDTNTYALLAGDGITYDIQSPARPFGLDVVAPVQMAGSDEASADFMANTLPEILDYIQSNILHSSEVELISAEANPFNLALENPANVRVYFVGEEAGYHNSIGINFADDSGSMLIFPDASTASPYFTGGDFRQEYTSADYPLMPGDFIDIGSVEDGSFLDFFMVPNGAREATDAYSIDKTLNEDQMSHMRVLGVVDDSVVVLGFEDIKYGGDRDYDDVIIAVEIGEANLDSISGNFGL